MRKDDKIQKSKIYIIIKNSLFNMRYIFYDFLDKMIDILFIYIKKTDRIIKKKKNYLKENRFIWAMGKRVINLIVLFEFLNPLSKGLYISNTQGLLRKNRCYH